MIRDFKLKKVAIIFVLALIVFAIPITVYFAQQQQNTQSSASIVSEDTVVATINGKQIKKSDLRLVAQEQYEAVDVDDQALKDALITIEERAILDQAAVDFGIQLDTAWVDELVSNGTPEKVAKYQVLKNQVALKAVKNREAMTVSFWNTPVAGLNSLTQEEKDASEKQLTDGLKALDEAENGFNSGKDVLQIGDTLLSKYDSLRPVLAVNGVILNGLSDSDRVASMHPQVYEFGNSGLDRETQDAVFGLNVNDVKLISNSASNRGGIVFKVVSSNDNGANTYEEWFAQQKSSMVQELNVL